ncbi:cytosolic sulfotransferase 15-like [Actinidia eriantha]|uniref:cytosolic sulfotransferase 15-like n=1 Tax=Actinidia eriantha TaxID=165200 RepID=UPI00258E9ADC|nr:cytosolic sulfotransferase 15-like [Actinidia eriantha]XP_057512652.1 cytosolic sulfotransferase 15-like [Actinidia eriantha]
MENDQTRATIATATATTTTNKEADHDDCHDLLIASLPKEKVWSSHQLYLYQGFWCPSVFIREEMAVQQHFQARQNDIALATFPKSGTTWLKALAFSIIHRQHYSPSQNHPLLTSNPHTLVPFLVNAFLDQDLTSNLVHSPRLFSTHLPYHALPPSIKSFAIGCRIVYLCRNPYDTFISAWHFFTKARPDSLEPLSFNDAFDMYCRGVFDYGPFWDLVLGYWKESLERPQKVLFLKYEDLKENPIFHMKRLAEFMGVPFSIEEEKEGLIEEILRLCSFNNLRELDVNKTGKFGSYFENKAFFRRGEVGDWVNYLTPEMVERLDKIIQEKMDGFGLTFKTRL